MRAEEGRWFYSFMGFCVGYVLACIFAILSSPDGPTSNDEQVRCEAVHQVCGRAPGGDWLPVTPEEDSP